MPKVKSTKYRDKNTGETFTLEGDAKPPHGDCVILVQQHEEEPAEAPAKGKGK